MLKLIYKDIKLLLSKRSEVALVLIGIPALFFILANKRYNSGYGIIYLMASFTIILSFDYDKEDKSKELFLSLPVTRKEIVLSKYIMVPVFIIFYILLINLYGLALNFLNINNNLFTKMNENVGLFLFVSIIASICLPMYFSFSTNVARGLSYFVIIMAQNSGFSVDYAKPKFTGYIFNHLGGIWAIVIGLSILLVSLGSSIIIYKEHDL